MASDVERPQAPPLDRTQVARRCRMMRLRRALADYLKVRRSLGFKLRAAGMLLPSFLAYLEQAGSPIITMSLAVEWATLPQDVHPAWWTSRLVAVRGFAKYLQTIEP